MLLCSVERETQRFPVARKSFVGGYSVTAHDGCVRIAKEKDVVEGVLLRVDRRTPTKARLALCDRGAFEKATRAMIVPRAKQTVTVQVETPEVLNDIEALAERREKPRGDTKEEPSAGEEPIVVVEDVAVAAQGPTLESLEARYEKLRVDDARRRLDDLRGLRRERKYDVDLLKDRLESLRDGDATGPAFTNYSSADVGNDDDDEEEILAWAERERSENIREADVDDLVARVAAGDFQNDDLKPLEAIDAKPLLEEARKLRADLKDFLPKDEPEPTTRNKNKTAVKPKPWRDLLRPMRGLTTTTDEKHATSDSDDAHDTSSDDDSD